jgi:hypothetical protein
MIGDPNKFAGAKDKIRIQESIFNEYGLDFI